MSLKTITYHRIIDLKKQFKKEMKANIRLYEKGEYYKIAKVIGENNSEKFFQNVKNITKTKDMKIQMEIEETADNYKNIFNDNLKVPQEQIEMVNREILSLDIKNYKSGDELKEDSKFKKPRKYGKSYCEKTPCGSMGFSQKASCRPYKNCYK
jgi:hypothetical protein